MSLSAFESVHRGLVNTRANWELILFQWLQAMLAGALVIAGLLPPIAALGFGHLLRLETLDSDWPTLLSGASSMLERGIDSWLLLLVSLVVASAIWLVAMMVYCFFQGGIYGVLSAGDRQAPGGPPGDFRWFRTFNWRDLRGWGRYFMWRFFWLFHVLVLVSIAWLLIPGALIASSVWSGELWGAGAGLAVGCAGAIPVLFSLVVLALWANLAQATLVGQDSGVLQAARTGLKLLGRRLGTVVFVFVVVVVASIIVSLTISVLATIVGLLLDRSQLLRLTIEVLVWMLQWGLSSAFGIGVAAALIGLVRSELAGAPAS